MTHPNLSLVEKVESAKRQIDELKDPSIVAFLPGASRVSSSVQSLLDELLKALTEEKTKRESLERLAREEGWKMPWD